MIADAALFVSCFSLVLSAFVAWFTLMRRGKVELSRPMSIYFGPDNYSHRRSMPKVYVRSLLFSTAKRGRVIESMFVSLQNGEMRQNFSVWVYGEHERYIRGSGLFVGEDGVSFNHHFLTPPENKSFSFTEGVYSLNIYIRILGERKDRLVFRNDFDITKEIAQQMAEKRVGVYFDWGPDSKRYWPHVDEGPAPSPDAESFIEALAKHARKPG